MALIKTLRRSVALFICPELGRASHRQAYRRPGLIAELRAAAPLFVPAILIDRIIIRGIDKALSPLVMAAPALEKRLRPHVSLLCGISNPSWAKRAERAALLWLLAEQETELEPTGEAGLSGQSFSGSPPPIGNFSLVLRRGSDADLRHSREEWIIAEKAKIDEQRAADRAALLDAVASINRHGKAELGGVKNGLD